MKFLRKKHLIITAIIFIVFGTGGYLEYIHPWRKTPDIQKLDISHYSNATPTPAPEEITQIPSMNISFMHPVSLPVQQINPQLISITASSTDKADGILIYSVVTATDNKSLSVPFPITGKLKSVNSIQLREFDAKQAVYSDGKNETVLLILRQKRQLIVLRIPKKTNIASQDISEIVDTIRTLQ
jgi:hypothetical protein